MLPLLLFDIDRTLFDTDKRVLVHSEILTSQLHTPPQQLTAIRQAYYSSLKNSNDFNSTTYIKRISVATGIKFSQVKSAFFAPEGFTVCLFPDCSSSISLLSKKFTLGTFSEGFVPFQTKKLELTGILPFFDSNFMFILRRKTSPKNLAKIPPGSIIVDDNLEVINTLVKFGKFTPIWLNRKSSDIHPSVKTIHSLKELNSPFPLLD